MPVPSLHCLDTLNPCGPDADPSSSPPDPTSAGRALGLAFCCFFGSERGKPRAANISVLSEPRTYCVGPESGSSVKDTIQSGKKPRSCIPRYLNSGSLLKDGHTPSACIKVPVKMCLKNKSDCPNKHVHERREV